MKLEEMTFEPREDNAEPITDEWLNSINDGARFRDLNGWLSWRIQVIGRGDFTVASCAFGFYVGYSAVNGFLPQWKVTTRGHVRHYAAMILGAEGEEGQLFERVLNRDFALVDELLQRFLGIENGH